VVVVLRHPLNTISSWRRLGWTSPFDADARTRRAWPRARAALPSELRDLPPEPPVDRVVARMAWQFGALLTAVQAGVRRHPEWHVVRHEELTADAEAVPALAGRLGLAWTDEAERFRRQSDRPGDGTYDLAREHAGERRRWEERLTPGQVDDALFVLQRFPGAEWMLGAAS
jgi:hypothetical protein